MDRKCAHCNTTTDDGHGYCLFCKTPFPAEAEVPFEATDPDAQLDVPSVIAN